MATPSTIAMAVRLERSLRVRSPRKVIRIIGLSPPDLLDRLLDLFRSRLRQLPDDCAVAEEEDAIGDRGHACVVSDHDDRLSERLDRVVQEIEDLAAGPG